MKTVRMAALGALFVSFSFLPGQSDAVGQESKPATSAEPGFSTQYSNRTYSWSGSDYGIDTKLAKQYVKATKDEEKKDIRKKLSDSLNKEFDQLAQKQQAELDELEKQVATLKATLKKRKDSKDSIVERRLEQLIQEAEGLGWGSSKSPNSPFSNGNQSQDYRVPVGNNSPRS